MTATTLPIGNVEQTTECIDTLIRNVPTHRNVFIWLPHFYLYVRVTKKEALSFLRDLKRRTHAPSMNRVVGRWTINDNDLFLSHKHWNGAA